MATWAAIHLSKVLSAALVFRMDLMADYRVAAEVVALAEQAVLQHLELQELVEPEKSRVSLEVLLATAVAVAAALVLRQMVELHQMVEDLAESVAHRVHLVWMVAVAAVEEHLPPLEIMAEWALSMCAGSILQSQHSHFQQMHISM
jgi:hypothetical protein